MRPSPLEVEIYAKQNAAAADVASGRRQASASKTSALIGYSMRSHPGVLLLKSEACPAEHEWIPAICNREGIEIAEVPRRGAVGLL